MSKRAIGVKEFERQKFKVMAFKSPFKELIGEPECSGSMIIYGESGHGKTTFALRLMKYISKFYKCAYVSIESALKKSFQDIVKGSNLRSVARKVQLWEELTVADLYEKLKKPRAPKIVFIDSLQYLQLNDESMNQLTSFQYKKLIKDFPNVLFIFISHAKNGEPKGALAEAVYYGSDTCLLVDDFIIYPKKARFGGHKPLELKDLAA